METLCGRPALDGDGVEAEACADEKAVAGPAVYLEVLTWASNDVSALPCMRVAFEHE